jgi:hypothetical protein
MERAWTKKKKINYRVEVSRRSFRGRDPEDICEEIAEDLNTLFQEHKDFDTHRAEINYDEIDVCFFCDEPYEEDTDVKGEPYCAICGKGPKEMMLEKLKDAKQR